LGVEEEAEKVVNGVELGRGARSQCGGDGLAEAAIDGGILRAGMEQEEGLCEMALRAEVPDLPEDSGGVIETEDDPTAVFGEGCNAFLPVTTGEVASGDAIAGVRLRAGSAEGDRGTVAGGFLDEQNIDAAVRLPEVEETGKRRQTAAAERDAVIGKGA
jgi:hypothetical protein